MKLKIILTFIVILAGIVLARVSSAIPDGAGNDIFMSNVGIGTTTPQTGLAVMGNVGIGTWTAAGGNLIINSSGNIGIGSAWPGKLLDINGTVRATTFSGDGSGLTGISASSGWTAGVNLVRTTTLTDNVGVGTSAPVSLFEITSTQARNLFRVNDDLLDSSPFVITDIGNVGIGTVTSNSLFEITSTANFDLFRVNDNGAGDTTPFLIDSTGNVGIGTTVIDAKFIIDQSASGSGNRFVVDTSNGSNVTLSFSSLYWGVPGFGGPLIQSCLTDANAGAACSNSLTAGDNTFISIQPYAGNVGIGTFMALGKMVVQGGNVGIGSNVPSSLLEINSTAAQDLFRVDDNGDNDTTPVVINSNGNVGIGSLTPGTPFDILATDNTTAMRIKINATQANVTAADTYISFNSTTGQEGSITGTAGAGVLVYNTFTGAHWTKIDDKTNLEPNMVLEATGEKFLDRKPQLVKSRVCSTRQSPYVWGVYGGPNGEGFDLVLSLGTGQIWVANTNGDIEVGDYLQSSSVFGLAEKQDDNMLHNYSIAKALEPVTWKPGETRRLIACTFHAG